eukprot:2832335-Rhodomonas_salina.4
MSVSSSSTLYARGRLRAPASERISSYPLRESTEGPQTSSSRSGWSETVMRSWSKASALLSLRVANSLSSGSTLIEEMISMVAVRARGWMQKGAKILSVKSTPCEGRR